MKLEVNGKAYSNFKSATVEKRLDALSNTYSFTAVSINGETLPFKVDDSCRVLVDDEPVLTGTIEVEDGNHFPTNHDIVIQGRDKTGDLLDSSIGNKFDLTGNVSLKLVIEKVMADIGLTGVTVIDNANPKNFTESEDIESPEIGDNAFEYLEKIARKRQVLLTSNNDGNIVISKSPGEHTKAKLYHLFDSPENNILGSSWTKDTTGRFNIYKFASSLNPVAANSAGAISTGKLVNQNGQVIDQEVRAGRQLALVSEGPYSSGENATRAIWEANVRKARGTVYSCVVQGYRPDAKSDLWDVNKLAYVVDDYARVSAEMLINTVTFAFDLQGGRTTTLGFVNRNAYSLTLEEPATDKLDLG